MPISDRAALEAVGIVVKAEGVVETASGIKLTKQLVTELGATVKAAANDSRAYGQAQKDSAREADNFVKALREEAATLRLTAVQKKAYMADQLALTELQKAQAAQSLVTIQRYKDEQAALERHEVAMARMTGVLTKFGAAAGLALGGAVVGLAIGVKSVVNEADELNKVAQGLGVTVEWLSQVRYQGKLANLSNQELTSSFGFLTRQIEEAVNKTGNGERLFKAMGISVTDATGRVKTLDQLLPQMADSFAGYADGPKKSALAMEFFGRELGTRMLPLLNQGARGFTESAAEAQKFGIVIGDNLAKKAEQFNDNMTRVNASLHGTKVALADHVLPWLNTFLERLNAAISITGSFLGGLRLMADNPMAKAILAGGVAFPAALPSAAALAVAGGSGRDLKGLRERRGELEAEIAAGPRSRGGVNVTSARRDLDAIKQQIAYEEFKLRQGVLESFAGRGATIDDESVPGPGGEAPAVPKPKSGTATENLAARMRHELETIRNEMGRAADEIENMPEVKRYQDTLQKLETGDFRKGSAGLKKDIAAAAKQRLDEQVAARLNRDANKSQVAAAEERLQQNEKETQDRVAINARSIQLREDYANKARQIDISLIRDTSERAWAQFDEEKRLEQEKLHNLAEGTEMRKAREEEYAKWVVARTAQITEELKPQWKKMVEAYGDATMQMRDFQDRFITGGLRAGENAFTQWARTGKLSIKDVFATLREEAARSIYQRNIAPTFAGILEGASGYLARALGLTPAAIPVDRSGAVIPDMLQEERHAGGIIGAGGAPMRSVPLSMFAGARRYHAGGIIGPDEVPIIARKNEEMLTEADPRHRFNMRGTGSSLRVELVNQGAPKQVTRAEQTFDAKGAVIRLLVEDVREGGPASQAIASTFNLRR